MTDLKDQAFKSSAFEPSEDELEEFIRNKRREKNNRHARPARRSPTPVRAIKDAFDSDSDSDEDLPDIADMFVPKSKNGKAKTRGSDDDDVCSFLSRMSE
jgi:hypothetical protein